MADNIAGDGEVEGFFGDIQRRGSMSESMEL